MMSQIQFYRANEKYGYFSNFAPYPIKVKGREWPTSEHYFQSQKFAGHKDEEEIRSASSPMKAAKMGRDRKRPFRKDWEYVKDNIMREALYAKFTQHLELKSKLLATGNASIIEHTKNDSYWGDGGDGSGKNMLGKLLMELREKLEDS